MNINTMTFDEWWRNEWCKDDTDLHQCPDWVIDAMREAWYAALEQSKK